MRGPLGSRILVPETLQAVAGAAIVREERSKAMTGPLVDRIRNALAGTPGIAEIKMFGGTCFTLNGNMLVGTMKDGGLLARVGETGEAEALARPGATRMTFTGREMKGFVIVTPDVLDDAALKQWIAMASAYVGTMPHKVKKPASKPARSNK